MGMIIIGVVINKMRIFKKLFNKYLRAFLEKLLCKHLFEVLDSLQPFSNVKINLLQCTKCGKLKKVKLRHIVYK